MKNLYYDEELSRKIDETFQNNVVISEKKYRDYVELYPHDYSMKVRYANNLIILGKYDKAETILDLIEEEYVSDCKYMGSKKNINIFKNKLIVTKLKLYIYTKRYEEAYELLNENYSSIRTVLGDFLAIELFLKDKLHMEQPEFIPDYFLYNQILDYDYDKFIDVIKICHTLENHSEDASYFASDFPLEEVMSEVKLLIPNNKKLNNGMIDNHYYFKYNNCGYDNGEITNYFTLVTYDDSDKFIAMLPIQEKEKYPYIDINYLKRDNLPPHKRVRALSQMDKFRMRYGNF